MAMPLWAARFRSVLISERDSLTSSVPTIRNMRKLLWENVETWSFWEVSQLTTRWKGKLAKSCGSRFSRFVLYVVTTDCAGEPKRAFRKTLFVGSDRATRFETTAGTAGSYIKPPEWGSPTRVLLIQFLCLRSFIMVIDRCMAGYREVVVTFVNNAFNARIYDVRTGDTRLLTNMSLAEYDQMYETLDQDRSVDCMSRFDATDQRAA